MDYKAGSWVEGGLLSLHSGYTGESSERRWQLGHWVVGNKTHHWGQHKENEETLNAISISRSHVPRSTDEIIWQQVAWWPELISRCVCVCQQHLVKRNLAQHLSAETRLTVTVPFILRHHNIICYQLTCFPEECYSPSVLLLLSQSCLKLTADSVHLYTNQAACECRLLIPVINAVWTPPLQWAGGRACGSVTCDVTQSHGLSPNHLHWDSRHYSHTSFCEPFKLALKPVLFS